MGLFRDRLVLLQLQARVRPYCLLPSLYEDLRQRLAGRLLH